MWQTIYPLMIQCRNNDIAAAVSEVPVEEVNKSRITLRWQLNTLRVVLLWLTSSRFCVICVQFPGELCAALIPSHAYSRRRRQRLRNIYRRRQTAPVRPVSESMAWETKHARCWSPYSTSQWSRLTSSVHWNNPVLAGQVIEKWIAHHE